MLKFLKSAIFNGLIILLPILFLIIILKEFVELIIVAATPLADLLFSAEVVESFPSIEILAALLILGAAFFLGVMSLVRPGAAFGRLIEQKFIIKIPVYLPLKNLFHALLGADDSESFKPVLIRGDSGELEPAYIIEDVGRPRVTVLVPWTPASFAGSLKFVPRERLIPLDLTFDEFSLALGHYGLGLFDKVPLEEDFISKNEPDKA